MESKMNLISVDSPKLKPIESAKNSTTTESGSITEKEFAINGPNNASKDQSEIIF